MLRIRYDEPTQAESDRLYHVRGANQAVGALVGASTGGVVERVLHKPYGQPTVLNGAQDAGDPAVAYGEWTKDADGKSDWDNQVLWCGYRRDPETGLYHVRNRMYHPTLSRWLSRDPLGYIDGPNLYGYCGNHPGGFVDPAGLRKYEEVKGYARDPNGLYGTYKVFHVYDGFFGTKYADTIYIKASDWDNQRELHELLMARGKFLSELSWGAGVTASAMETVLRFTPQADLSEFLTGEDFITGEELSWGEWALAAAGCIPGLGNVDDLGDTAKAAKALDKINEARKAKRLGRLGLHAADLADAVRVADRLEDAEADRFMRKVFRAAKSGKRREVRGIIRQFDNLDELMAAGKGLRALEHASDFGIRPYRDLRKAVEGTGLYRHHLIQQRFSKVMEQDVGEMLSIVLTHEEHIRLDRHWRELIPYGKSPSRERVLETARQVYEDFPEILRALGL